MTVGISGADNSDYLNVPQVLEAALGNQKLQVDYVTAKGEQVETEVRQFLPEFVPDQLRKQTQSLNQQWSNYEQVAIHQ